ncbi:MAG: hypothetical protein WD492_09170 [Alkalispirochaeta sp.]
MRYFTSFLLLIFLVVSVSAQDVDITKIEPRDLDPDLLDVSEASFYFQGPVQVYVENLRYGNNRYAAVLDYDGGRTLEVYAPEEYGAGIRPEAIDLSRAKVELNPDGTISVTDAVVDGYRYAATLKYSNGRTLAATGQIQQLGPSPEARSLARVQGQLREARRELEERENRIQELQSGNPAMAQLQERLEQRNNRIERLGTRVSALESRIQQLESPRLPELPRRLHAGFSGQSNSFGNWARPGNTLEQTDADARFAKHVYPVRQSGTEFSYSVSATAPDSGWVGYGIHFLADGARTTNGYGYGDSYLIWVTRDPRNQTNRGYVQLYRSFNDVRMIQVANAILPISSFDDLETTVYVNTAEREIQVYLEGRYAFTFPAEDLKNLAPEVSLRALGPVTFTDLMVRGR